MRRNYIWEQPNWPAFRWDAEALLTALGQARRQQGAFSELVGRLGFAQRQQAQLDAAAAEATDTSRIEGEDLDYQSVRSSVARRLGMPDAAILPEDARAAGVVEMTLDATEHFTEALTTSRLFRWHAGLFPLALGQSRSIRVGAWRTDSTGPMQVVSGRVDAPTVHYEAPPANRVPAEAAKFLEWFNATPTEDGLVRSALAHLWFVTIHPFDDGNGRISRAIADMALARDDQSSQRFFSMSRQILKERHGYYDVLEQTQAASLDVTKWIAWFLACYVRAIDDARIVLVDVLRASRFWIAHADVTFSERQRKVLNRFLHQFDGKLTARKWAALTHTSADTAQRDITDLVEKRVLVRNPGGSKNTSYDLAPF